MRFGWVVCAMLLAGCVQPAAPQAQPPGVGLILPPSVLFDRTANGTLQLYVHAKQGNVRLDWINVTQRSDAESHLTWTEAREAFEGRYAVDLDLGRARANLTVEAADRDAAYAWSGRVALNDSVPSRARVEPWTEQGWGRAINVTLPFETYLARAEEQP